MPLKKRDGAVGSRRAWPVEPGALLAAEPPRPPPRPQAAATVTAAAANVCGSGYTISAGAARYGTNASLYLWWNGKYSGSNKLYDKYICGVLFNDTGSARSMGIRLKDNFTDTPHAEDFGTYSTYAGPVYQKRGGCGEAYSYMKSGSRVVVDNTYTMSGCN